MESVLALEQWLATQACVESARAPRGSAEGVAAALLLTTDPPRVPIEVVFRTRREGPVPYRLLLDLGTDRGLHFVSLERRSP